ncbi:MAG TPA: hypothetical protein PLP23_00685 [Panacibacter sp.]|nr:hypothetical protein [Panacibacter sp.]
MANTKKAAQPDTVSKKTIREDIEKKIEAALGELKAEIGEKKFKNRVKKAAKILAHGFKNVSKAPVIKKAEKTAVVKKATKATVKKAAKKVAAK